MYLPSKFFKSKYAFLFSFIVIIIVYVISQHFLRGIFVYFSRNLLLTHSQYEAELNELAAARVRLSLEVERLKALGEENQRLKALLELKEEENIKLQALPVIGIEPSRFRKVLIVSGGNDCGLEEGMFVLDGDGVFVGKLFRVFGDYSEVILVTDPQFFLTVKIGEALGLLKGTLGGALRVFYIEEREKLSPGDDVWAVSYRSYPDFRVGTVSKVRPDPNSLFLDITVQPLSRGRLPKIVFVVK